MTTHLDKFIAVSPKEMVGARFAWLDDAREAGKARFNALGIPTVKNEDWKYTNLRALASKQFSAASHDDQGDAAEMATLSSSKLDAYRLVFVNGIFQVDKTGLAGLPSTAIVCPVSEALEQHSEKVQMHFAATLPDEPNAFASLNNGLFEDGAFIHLGQDVQLGKPIELVFISSGEQTLNMPRNLISLQQGAQASVVERYLCAADSSALCNAATEVDLQQGAQCDYYLVQAATEANKASHIGGTWVRQAADSRFSARTITMGMQLVRNELKVTLAGEQAHTDCIGFFMGDGREHIDNHTTIRHSVPNCTSREVYKGILDGRARGVFHGRVMVDEDAQQTFAEQENANLLLSRDAEVDTKPQLEIYADDVKCSHGATVGELDPKQIFYLQSRGIDKVSARALLTYGFAAEVLDEIDIPELKAQLQQRVVNTMDMDDLDNFFS